MFRLVGGLGLAENQDLDFNLGDAESAAKTIHLSIHLGSP